MHRHACACCLCTACGNSSGGLGRKCGLGHSCSCVGCLIAVLDSAPLNSSPPPRVPPAPQLAALQMVPQSDAAALSALPSDALLCAAVGFPAGSVTRMEANLSAALGGAPKAISALRSLKLFLERLGCEQQARPLAALSLLLLLLLL